MGFDNECILNIQSLAGEYFCPVCRLLVYPNEALQSQCTHLYCKPCLTYVVGTTKACPYDGYLVTEADSKPLTESNKALAETIGKIVVHCLYHRSGCTWQGPLSECTSHCSGCAFGNSPVVCNRCGVQIVHRQVQEHAQSCPGVQPQTQQAQGVQDTSASSTAPATSSADTSQTAAQSGAPSSQSQTTAAAAPPGQDPNQQSSGNPQAQAVAPVAAPTPEQWYQQQYQQYYQQYPGYDPYQQTYQHYYPYQQQAVQPYQPHAQHLQGQQQTQAFMQQPQPQPQPQPQVPNQPQAQPQSQGQHQAQPQSQGQPQAQPQSQVQPQAQPQIHQNVQMPLPVQHQNQVQVNPQQQVNPLVQPSSQMPSQNYPPHGFPHPQPQSQPQLYPQTQPLPQPHSVQSHPQHVQMPQYQQPLPQIQQSQPQIQPQPHSQVQPQHHSLPQPQPPANPLAHPQSQVPHHPHSHPPLHLPPQSNQPPNSNTQPQTQYPSAHAVTGHQSYPQPQTIQQMPPGGQPMHMHPQSGPLPQPPAQTHNQFPHQQPPHMRPPQPQAPMQQQQPTLVQSQGQVPNVPPQHTLHSHVQQPGQPVHQRPVMQPVQQPVPQNFLQQQQQQQPFPAQTSAPVHNQLHQQVHHMQPQQPPMQPHMRPLPHLYSQSHSAPNLQPLPSQNYVGRPPMSNPGAQSQSFVQPTGGFAPAQVRPTQVGANQQSVNPNFPPRTSNQHHMPFEHQSVQSGMVLKPTMFEGQNDHMSKKSAVVGEDGTPSQSTTKTDGNGLVPTGLGADAVVKSEADLKSLDSEQKLTAGNKDSNSHVGALAKDTDSELHTVENGSGEPAVKPLLKKESSEVMGEPSLRGSGTVEKEQNDDSLSHRAESSDDHGGKLPKDADNHMLVSAGADKGMHEIPSAPDPVLNSSVSDVAARGNSETPRSGREPIQHGFQERNMSQPQVAPLGPGFDERRGFSQNQDQGKNFGHPLRNVPFADQVRHPPSMHYPPSTHQQRPPAPSVLQPPSHGPVGHGHLPGQSPSTLRPQGPGPLSQPGQPLNPGEHFQSSLNQPHGSFQPEIPLGANLGPGPASSFGRGPAQFGPQQGNFELQPGAPQGQYNRAHVPPSHPGLPRISQGEPPVGVGPPPGSFDSHLGVGGRPPRHGPEGQFGQLRPNNQVEAEFFPDQRLRNYDGRPIDSHLPGAWEKGPLGQPPVMDSNAMRMKHAPGLDSSSGLRDERFNPLMEERVNPFPLEPVRPLDQGPRPVDKAPLRDNYDGGLKLDGAHSRFLPPYHFSGTSLPNDAGERGWRSGPDDNFGRADSSRTHSDFRKPTTGYDRHHMDNLNPRSPGREYPGIPSHGFGSLSGGPRRQSGMDDIDGVQSRPFDEKPRSFNGPPNPVGNSFHESRFPLSPGRLRRGELDGPGNLWGGDFAGQDVPPSHMRGENFGPRHLPGHLRFGDSSSFGHFPGPARMGELAGRGNLPHNNLPFGEPFGGNKSGHPRLGEPGFRSSYSLQGFPRDGGFFDGGMDSSENSRKRKPASMGWCRICRVDCESVEGLDLHSQTREHQKKAMNMVLSIKQQNARKQKKSNDRASREEASKIRSGNEGRGNKA